MTFDDVINDISKLIGMELQSIRPGAEIVIQEVDEARECLILRTAQDQYRSRPLGELKLIWGEMMKLPAVHVDGVLHGSGTSRNQPETILANLPYVEWLKLNNKKHIAYVGQNTHPYGTLKQMDSFKIAEISQKMMLSSTSGSVKMVAVSPDVSSLSSYLQQVLHGVVSSMGEGVYSYRNKNVDIMIVSSLKTNIPEGSYSIIDTEAVPGLPVVHLQGDEYYLMNTKNLKALLRKKK